MSIAGMSIAIRIEGNAALAARFAALPTALRARLASTFAGISEALYAQVLDNLSGAVVNIRSGRLLAAVSPASDENSASVVLDTDAAPYGAALEFGASIPAQLIAAKNARALAFTVGGSQVFAKHVMHPAFALPPHSFLRSALAALAPDAIDTIAAAVAETVAP